MQFEPETYGPDVARILALDGNGRRAMPLVITAPACPAAVGQLRTADAKSLFRRSRAPEAALSGLWLYFSCFDEAHSVAQDIEDAEGSYWHAIVHRQEPDAGNSGYWFRRVGRHPIFPQLRQEASEIIEANPTGLQLESNWDPFRFVEFCETARQRPGSSEEDVARRIQLAEWQLLFDYCARPGS